MHILGAVTQVQGGIEPQVSFVYIVLRVVENKEIVDLVLGAQTAFKREAAEAVLQRDVGVHTAVADTHILGTDLIHYIVAGREHQCVITLIIQARIKGTRHAQFYFPVFMIRDGIVHGGTQSQRMVVVLQLLLFV